MSSRSSPSKPSRSSPPAPAPTTPTRLTRSISIVATIAKSTALADDDFCKPNANTQQYVPDEDTQLYVSRLLPVFLLEKTSPKSSIHSYDDLEYNLDYDPMKPPSVDQGFEENRREFNATTIDNPTQR